MRIHVTNTGMTIKFFPLFFQAETGMQPMALNGIYVAQAVLGFRH